MLSVDQIVTLISPVREMAGDEAWRAALARLGGEVETADGYAAKIARSKTVPQYAGTVGQKERTIWEWVQRGKIISFKTPGGRRLIDPADNSPDRSA